MEDLDKENRTEKKKKKKMNRGLKAFLIVLIVLLSLIVLAAGTIFVMGRIGASKFPPATVDPELFMEHIKNSGGEGTEINDDGTTIYYNGKTYVQNKNVMYFAFLGVDKETLDLQGDRDHSAGQSDTNIIVAIDKELGKMSLIVIPRDTMAEVNILKPDGSSAGYSEMQLCVAYAYGDGRETSCKNVLESIEKLLFGIKMENYYSLDLSGIGSLNDAVGGVELTCKETIRHIGTEGDRITLWGNSARTYVQYRDTSNPDSDTLRRARQIQYMKAYVSKAFSAIKSQFPGKITELYGIATQYGCTNFDITHTIHLAEVLVSKHNVFEVKDEDIHVLKGEGTRPNGGFLEVRLDKDEVLRTILEVFYKEKTN